ncbi:hypothetical protein [Mucilaginibacter psychrotolerans]|uniref:Uncharacterized protein n=1 Tax=Mucilaginibacter psychrotolerans TaxID=1524096 RepID=A0A4Y8SA47_9SPHI|nr:hypothetical protein [Mucilaginibacter psychrotolerans]TFF35500.1 hypothetical protein E2R66_18610 [Mucilaginibacter psychrotolerans]
MNQIYGIFSRLNNFISLLASAQYEDAEGWIFQLKEDQERFAPWTQDIEKIEAAVKASDLSVQIIPKARK